MAYPDHLVHAAQLDRKDTMEGMEFLDYLVFLEQRAIEAAPALSAHLE